MRLTSISFSNFRNLVDGALDFRGDTISIIGRNGQGKTNLLEAACMGACYRSFRTLDRSAVVASNSEWARVVTTIDSDNARTVDTEAIIKRIGRDILKFQGNILKSQSQFFEVPVVTFHPPDIDLIRGGPAARRVFVDAIASQVLAGYGTRLRRAERLVQQRNHLLNQLLRSQDRDLQVTLDVFDEKLSALSSQVSNDRALVIEKISGDTRDLYSRISAFESSLEVSYAGRDSDELLMQLREARGHDVRTGATSVGFHREDVNLSLDKRPLRTSGSQGEMRSAVLALKFAQAYLYGRERGEGPLLFLDDVFSELDSGRVTRLLGELPSYQVWVTGTSLPDGWVSDQVVTIESGQVYE